MGLDNFPAGKRHCDGFIVVGQQASNLQFFQGIPLYLAPTTVVATQEYPASNVGIYETCSAHSTLHHSILITLFHPIRLHSYIRVTLTKLQVALLRLKLPFTPHIYRSGKSYYVENFHFLLILLTEHLN